MARCLHIYDSGFQCTEETLEATDFCESHQKVAVFESDRLEQSIWRKAILRFVAFVLLIMFLVPLLYSLKNLYSARPNAVREAW